MKFALLSSIFIVFSLSAKAHWTLIEDESSLSFVSTKNQHISEVQQFTKLKAEFGHEGKFQLEIDLASIDSGIEIRDTRMRENLFLLEDFAVAKLTAQLPNSVLKQTIGSSELITVAAQLSLIGKSKMINVTVQVTRQLNDGIVATSTQPILISAVDFGLDTGIDTLLAIAGLDSIGYTVPVNFNLVFAKH
ncbi:YceI family protein [uncultured Paraglaciecola sp.]|uniref:YceI family protein n=1 Tax=uncultured Paraglaciecola sp. TaxID=1765024 RepID=UPI00260D186B|nr:YceI family protein [uncultured Paraglaciecola sp.]